MNYFSALFISLLLVAFIGRLHAPDGSEEASNDTKQGKPEFSESSHFVTNTEDTKQSESFEDDKSIPLQEIMSTISSSTSELEEIVSPTVAPATPSYDSEPSTTTDTASSIVSHSQENSYVYSSVILIPPNNPEQIQSSASTQDNKESTYSEPVPTQDPEVLSSVLDSSPQVPISKKPAPTPPTPAMAKEEEDSITAALNQAEEESKPKDEEEMPSFDEFKRRVLQEEEEKSKQQTAENGIGTAPKPKPKKVKERKQSNYASVDCGAKILDHNQEASNSDSILVENKDLYMLNPCSAKIWFIVELCDVAYVKSIQIANFELFSSTPESFRVYVSKRYPTREWTMLGTFQAREERTIQTFPLDEPIYAKYFKVEMLSHFGSEHYCPLSLLRVHGSSMMEELEDHEIDGQDDTDNSDADSDVPVLPPEPGAKAEDEAKKPNLLERAADTVISLVKKITGNGHVKEKGGSVLEEEGNVEEKGVDVVDVSGSSEETASSESEAQSESKNKIVTLVGHEELEETTAENKTSNASDTSQDSSEKQDTNSKDGKSTSVNISSEDSSLCEEMENERKSSTTSIALTPCQAFAQAIGQCCLGCFMGRLLFSMKQYQDFTFVVDGWKPKLFNTTSAINKKIKKQRDELQENNEKDDQDKVNKQEEVQVAIQDESSVSESSVQKNTPSETEKQEFTVNVPEPSSSSSEVKSENTVSSPVNVLQGDDASSRIVRPSQSVSITQKIEPPGDQTPSLAEVSVVTETPSNSSQSSSSTTVMLQSSELPVFKESELVSVKEESGNDEKKSVKERHQNVLPSSQSVTVDIQPAPSENKESSNEPAQPVEHNKDIPKVDENKEDVKPDETSESACQEDEAGPTSTECKAPNSLHMVPHSAPDIDVLETKLTDKEGREGTALLPEEVEKDPLPVLNGASQDKEVVDSENVKVEWQGGKDTEKKETSPNAESQDSGSESSTTSLPLESQSTEPTVQPGIPASQPVIDNTDLLDSVLPLPAPPIASVSSQELTAAAASDATLDATMLSKAQQAASSSAGTIMAVGSGGHKESIFVRLSNKIKSLEQNLNVSTLYMEQLNQRYRKSLDELQKNSEKKIALLTNATKKAEVVINSQKEQITKLQSMLDNLTSVVADMKARMDPLNKEVMERHVIGLCIEVALIVMLFVVFARRNNNQNVPETPREPVHLMNGKGPPRLAIEDCRKKDCTFQPTVSLSGREQLLRSFGKNCELETVGASTTSDENKLHKADPYNPNESKKKRNRKRKASNTPEPPPDSPSGADSPSPASFVSRTAGLLFFSARGLFSGLHNSWKPKKPTTVHSDPGLSVRSEENHATNASSRLRQPVMTRAKSLDSVPEETTSRRLAPPPPPPPPPPEVGVVFKRPPDCYYSKKNSVRNITQGPMKYGKYGVLDTQLA